MRLPFLVLAVLLSTISHSQIDYPIFRDSSKLPADSNRLQFEVDNFNYIRNYEYTSPIPLSYTLIGYHLIPSLSYQPHPNFKLKGGVFLRREFGRSGFEKIHPVLTAKYQKKGTSLIMGTLEGALNHRFIEPIYDVESMISDRIEQGLQLILDKKHYWLDLYLDWEKGIKRYSTYPEEFTTGISSRIKTNPKAQTKIEFPVQFMVAHRGGQIDTSTVPGFSLLNFAAGASLNFDLGSSWLNAIKTEHHFAYYKELSGRTQLFQNGTGWYSNLIFKTKWNTDIDLRYWRGDGFVGPRGGALFQSVSEKDQTYTEQLRELLFFNLIFDKELVNNLYLHLRLEPYYDLRNKFAEYSWSVMLRFKGVFEPGRR